MDCCTRRLRTGDPAALLPIIHYVLLRFSRHVALDVAASGYEVRKSRVQDETKMRAHCGREPLSQGTFPSYLKLQNTFDAHLCVRGQQSVCACMLHRAISSSAALK